MTRTVSGVAGVQEAREGIMTGDRDQRLNNQLRSVMTKLTRMQVTTGK